MQSCAVAWEIWKLMGPGVGRPQPDGAVDDPTEMKHVNGE